MHNINPTLFDAKGPNLSPIMDQLGTWGTAFLSFAAGMAAIYFAVMIVIKAYKAGKEEDPNQKKQYVKDVVWKVVWFLVVVSGSVIFGMLSSVIGQS